MPTNVAGKSVLCRRYAKAFYDLAKDKKLVDKVGQDLTDLRSMMEDSEELRRVLVNPVIPRNVLTDGVVKLGKKAKFQALTVAFCGVLGDNRRLELLPGITQSFIDLVAEDCGEVVAKVTSASALNKTELKKIADSLKKATGKNITLEDQVDPTILGGLIVKMGSKMLDDSLLNKLERMRLYLKESSV